MLILICPNKPFNSKLITRAKLVQAYKDVHTNAKWINTYTHTYIYMFNVRIFNY